MTGSLSYYDIIRSHRHEQIAALPSYSALRHVLSEIGSEAADCGGIKLSEFLDALRDMVGTVPFGDVCDECWRDHKHGTPEPHDPRGDDMITWPHLVKRHGEFITGTYRCKNGHTWTCTNLISIIGL